MTLTLVASGTRRWISAWRRSGMLGNLVVHSDHSAVGHLELLLLASEVVHIGGEVHGAV